MGVPQKLDGPVATRMPDAPSGDFMSHEQWETYYALLDGVIPAIVPASILSDKEGEVSVSEAEFDRIVAQFSASLDNPPDRQTIVEYLAYRPSQNPRFREDCLRLMCISPARFEFAKLMALLGTHHGSLLFTGYWNPITQQPAHIRHAIIKKWSTSRVSTLRSLARTMGAIGQRGYSATNPFLESVIGYTDVPRDWKPVEGYDFRFIQIPQGEGIHELTTDVVIIGSGCGGAVSAKNLAESGHSVLVVDKGYYFPPSHLPMNQEAGSHYLYDRGGSYASEDGSASVLCGGSWGGGGTINWSVCFKLQDYVRQEWSDGGLPLFKSTEFDQCMDRVWKFCGASTSGIRHNHSNNVMLDGSKKLGWHNAVVNQNTANKEHYCGQCHLGCGSAEKRGPAVSWLPAAGDAGAEFMEGFQADKVLFAEDGVTAIGVEGVWTSRDSDGRVHKAADERTQRRVVIKAKKVIVSAGSLWSPIVLMNSGIENKNLGHNLHIHPVCNVVASYRHETRPWEGGIITSYSGEFENLDEMGHGVKLEPLCMVPFLCLAVQAWSSGLDAKLLSLKYRNTAAFISLTRDRDSGSVFRDPVTGQPRIKYTASDFDRENTLEGVVALAKICYVTGATEIRVPIMGVKHFSPDPISQKKYVEGKDPEFTDAQFAKWLQRLRKIGNKPPTGTYSSAHQMGTCRMSATADSGVVDESGLVWGTKNLYVADASVFPSASGVNPMVTTMSLADWISRGVAKELSK